MLSVCGRYTASDFTFSSTLSNSGALHACYYQKCSPDLSVGAELATNLRLGAGESRATLEGSVTGVFLAIAANDFAEVLKSSPARHSVYATTGSNHSIASGRLAFVLGLQGPCAAYDAACPPALVAGAAAR